MKQYIKRYLYHPTCTIGKMYLDMEDGAGQVFYCSTLEPTLRPDGIKIMGKTAIPAGAYLIKLVLDPNLQKDFPQLPANSLFPQLQNVPNFIDVYQHIGNKPSDTLGCTLMGTYSELVPDTLTGSTLAFTNLLKILKTKNITEWMAVYSNE